MSFNEIIALLIALIITEKIQVRNQKVDIILNHAALMIGTYTTVRG